MALVLGDNFSYQGAKPLDGRIKYDTLANMKAVADATMYDGCLAYCSETDKTYQWKSTNTVDETLGRWREFSSGSSETTDYPDLTNKPSINDVTLSGNKTSSDLGLQAEMQLSTMPTADADYLGKTVQYVGATENGYTHNYFYECVSDGESTPTYSWQQSNVQPSSGGGGGGHTIEDSEGTDLTQRDTLQFGEGFTASDDSTNEKTVITPDVMQSGDMDDVLTPLPSVQPRYHAYSTTEQIIGYDENDNPVYEKTIGGTIITYTDDSNRRTFQLGSIANVSNVKELSNSSVIRANGYHVIGFDLSNSLTVKSSVCGWIDIETDTLYVNVVGDKTFLGDSITCNVTVRYTKTTT